MDWGLIPSPSYLFPDALPTGAPLQSGAYLIDAILGQGGFGITYLARDCSARSQVAIKEFFPAGCHRDALTVQPSPSEREDYEAALVKFSDEARILKDISNPHIVAVHDSFEENGTVYLVMEYLHGKTLLQFVTEKGALPEAEAVKYIEQIGQAVDAIHQLGLLHRDLKPGNMMKCDNGRVVLFDFGTARAFESGKTVGMTAQLTPGYAPLEQYGRNARFGVYTDIYSLGATLYHLLTGDPPVPATDRATGVPLPPPEQVNPYITHITSAAMLWAMEMRVAERPQSIEEFLLSLHEGLPIKSRDVPQLELPCEYKRVKPEREEQDDSAPEDHDMLPAGLPQTVRMKHFNVRWPKRCACCGRDTQEVRWLFFARLLNWRIPYCEDCLDHLRRHGANRIAIAIGGLAMVGLPFSIILPPIASTAALLVLPVLSMSTVHFVKVNNRKSLRAMHRNCQTNASAVRVLIEKNYDVMLYFYNHKYCEEFCALNSDVVLSQQR